MSMHRIIWAALIAFAIAAIAGPFFIRGLKKLRIGQFIYEGAPEEHKKKQGTPTMGGLLFAAVSIVVAFALHTGPFAVRTDLVLALCVFTLLNLGIGFIDDFSKIRGKDNQKGLSERQKLVAQGLIALLFSLYCYFHPLIGSKIIVPFVGGEWELGPFYIPVMMFVVICTTNGANLLDGLDGLLAGVTVVICAFFAIVSQLAHVSVLAASLGGALLGYLCYNFKPARMMMGDTGSMYLGGMVAGLSMVTRLPLLIPIVAGAYAASLLSVFVQRWYFRLSGGKRIFRNSPLHHHFEMTGVPETKIVSMYALVTVILCLIGLLGVL